MASVDSLTESFNTDVKIAIDIHFPLKSVKIHPTDRPWMTSRIKQFILERRRAFHSNRNGRWRELRTRVRDEIAAKKKAFYSEKLSYLKSTNPRKWCSLVRKLSGKSSGASAISYEVDNKVLSGLELANRLKNYFVSVTSDDPALDYLTLPAFLPAPEELPVIRPTEVYKKLLRLSPFKACGPDAIPNQILKLFASELSDPVTTIFNRLPSAWRDAYISPIPKASPVTCDNDQRPVALTACLSKVFEDFVVQWLMEDIKEHIDPYQFCSLKGVSTTFCLLDMLHNWLSALESPGTYLFSKAFDHIDHNILVCKLLKMGARHIIAKWICSFLSQRRQAVKLDGLRKGTKLGPVLFLVMVNDLAGRSSY